MLTEGWVEGWQGGREEGGDLISELIMFPHGKRQWSWQFYYSIVSYGFWIKNKLASFKEDNPESLGDQWWVMRDCPWPPSSQQELCLQPGGLRAQQGWEWPPHSQGPRGGKLHAEGHTQICLVKLLANAMSPWGRVKWEWFCSQHLRSRDWPAADLQVHDKWNSQSKQISSEIWRKKDIWPGYAYWIPE